MVIRHRILIVDDDRLICWSLREALTQEGYDVTSVETGEAAIKEAERLTFDLLITDLKLPGVDGWEVLLEVRKKKPETKAVVISAFGSEGATEKARAHGASCFMSKPFEISQIKGVVNRLLSTEFRN